MKVHARSRWVTGKLVQRAFRRHAPTHTAMPFTVFTRLACHLFSFVIGSPP